jgi:hypothetical protein
MKILHLQISADPFIRKHLREAPADSVLIEVPIEREG